MNLSFETKLIAMTYIYTRKVAFLLTMGFFAIVSFANAQLGKIDTTFYGGKGIDYKCTGGVVLPDNSVVITGKFVYANEKSIQGIVKLFPDGSTDNSFNVGTGADDHVNAVVRQPDGKYIIGGDFVQFNGQTKNRLARLNADGSTDATFNTGTGFNGSVYTIYLQTDGKVLMGGTFFTYNGDTLPYFIRLNADGTRDTSFHVGGGFNNTVYSIDRQTDGKFIVGGSFTWYDGTVCGQIARINSNGTIDSIYNLGNSGPDGIVTAAYLLPNGKIIAAGYFSNYNGNQSGKIVRINSDGSFDNTFLAAGGFNTNVNEICIQPDGKIVATGGFATYKGATVNRIARIDSAGNRDVTFTTGTGLNGFSGNTVFMNPDGKIYVGGTFIQIDSFARLHLARLLPSGKVDHTFFRDSKVNSQLLAIAFQKNGKSIICGQFTKYNEVTTNRIARLNLDGSLDASFNAGSGANGIVRAVVVLPNDKILIAGEFTKYNGVNAFRIARLNADGSLDNTFVTGTGASTTIYAMVALPDGRIIIGGKFVTYNGTAINRIARLNANGALDNTFNVGTGFNNTVQDLVLQPDGKLVAVGLFVTYNGVAQNRVTRIDTSGARDNTFTIGTGASAAVNTVALQPDGKILIGGAFTKYNNITHNRIARLNADGTIDASYTASITNLLVNDIVHLSNPAFFAGGSLIGGTFTTVNGVTSNRLVFLDNNGVIDNVNYFVGVGADAAVNVMAINPITRKVFVGGDFKSVQNHLANRLVGVKNTDIDFEQVSPILCPGAVAQVYFSKDQAFYGNNHFIVQLSDSVGDFTNAIAIGNLSAVDPGQDSITITIPGNTPSGSGYLLRIISTNPNDTSSISGTIIITPPTVQAVTASGPTTFCSGGNVILSVPSGGQYNWSNGATGSEITVTDNGNYAVTANFSGCVSSSNPVSVTVNASPDSSVAISNFGLCGGGNATLTAASGLTYNWNTTATSQAINITQSGSYTVSVTAGNGCGADSTFTIDFATYFDDNLITADGPTAFCTGGSVTLSSLPGFGYSWSNSGNTQSIVVTATGDYVVTVSDGPCADTSSMIHVTVNSLPVISFGLPSDTICSNNGTINLSATPTGGTFTGNGVTGTIFDPQAFSGTNVAIVYDYTDGNSCSNSKSDTAFVTLCTGLNEIADNTISIFPNPAKHTLLVNSSTNDLKNLEVLNLFGQTVLKLNNENKQSHLSLDISSLATGTYILKTGEMKFRFVKAE